MLHHLQKENPQYIIKDIHDVSFKKYGRIVDINCQQAIQLCQSQRYQDGYLSSVHEIEKLPCIQQLSQKIYGGLDTIAGVVKGHNHVLNGLEYHQCSETIIAVSDYVLVVGYRYDMINQHYDSHRCECLYVPGGTVVECYATTLHYTPICVSDEGFQTVCLLLKGTGDPIERQGILKKKNKWFIAHRDNKEKIEAGDYPGLDGNMIKIRY